MKQERCKEQPNGKISSRKNITSIFFRNFILLIVVPILIILLVAMGILRSMMLQAEKDNIALGQESIRATLETELENDAITLAHFVLSNNERALVLASDILKETTSPYDLTKELNSYFRMIVTPHSDIVGLHFYSEDKVLSFHNDLQIPLSEVQQMPWYQSALENKGHTVVGSVPATITRKFLDSDKSHRVLVIAFSPEPTRETDAVEVVCLYMNSEASRQIHQKNQDNHHQKSYLLAQDNTVLMGEPELVLPPEVTRTASGELILNSESGPQQYLISPVRNTDWKLLSIASHKALLRDFNKVAVAVVVVSFILFGLFAVFSILFLRGILSPINRLVRGMEEVEQGNLDTRVKPGGQAELVTLTHSFNHMLAQMQSLMASNEAKERAKHQSEIKALQSQINPHFLVNTLNTMRFVAMSAKFESLQHMAEALITILSNSFKQSTSFYPLARELELLESYIYLMQIRYSEGFTVVYDIQKESRRCLLPRLLLQPVVENAIVHGFEGIEHIGEIAISSRLQEDTLLLQIQDNGKGISPALLPSLLEEKEASHGIGLYNVNQRIQLNFSADYGIRVESTPQKGTTITLELPVLWEQEENHHV